MVRISPRVAWIRVLTSAGSPRAVSMACWISASLASCASWPASSRSPWASATSRLVTPALALSTTTRVAGLASTTLAQLFMAAALATLVPPNLATLIGLIAYSCLNIKIRFHRAKREEEAENGRNERSYPGQKHSTRRAHPVPAPDGARWGMTTTDDNPGDSAPAADVEVSSCLTRL